MPFDPNNPATWGQDPATFGGHTPGMLGGAAGGVIPTVGGAAAAAANSPPVTAAPQTPGTDILTPNSPGLGGNTGATTVSPGFTGKQPTLGMSPSQMTPNGVDIASPGVGEKAFDATGKSLLDPSALSTFLSGSGGSALSAPGAGEQYWNKVSGSVNTPGNTQQVFNELHGQMPQIAATPGLDPYYNNAAKNVGEDLNRQFAARGLFGSTAATQGLGRAFTDLRADQAKNEANYNLARLGEERNWNQLLGGEASAADQARQTGLQIGGALSSNAQNEATQRTGLLGSLLTASGQLDLNKLSSYLAGAGQAQNLKQGRAQQLFGDTMAPSQAIAGSIGQSFGAETGADTSAMDSQIQALLGKAGDFANFTDAQRAQFMGDLSNVLNGIKTTQGIVSGGPPSAPSQPSYMSPTTSASGY